MAHGRPRPDLRGRWGVAVLEAQLLRPPPPLSGGGDGLHPPSRHPLSTSPKPPRPPSSSPCSFTGGWPAGRIRALHVRIPSPLLRSRGLPRRWGLAVGRVVGPLHLVVRPPASFGAAGVPGWDENPVLLSTTMASADVIFLREGVVGALQLSCPGSVFLCSGHRLYLPKP